MMAAFRLVLDDDLDAAADRRTAKLLLPEELLLVVPLPVEEVLCGSVALVGELARFRPRIVCIIISLYLCFDFDIVVGELDKQVCPLSLLLRQRARSSTCWILILKFDCC